MDNRDQETLKELAASPFEVMQRDCNEYQRLETELAYAEANLELIPNLDNALHEMCIRIAFCRVKDRCAAYMSDAA